MMLLLLFSLLSIVYGQLSVDELFFFKSKYTSIGNCTDFQYIFSDLRIKDNNYNQIIFNCNSSSITFKNKEQTSSLICPNNEYYFESFAIHFHYSLETIIEINQLHLHGIELCSLDDLIRNIYHEYSYYRSQWALLINFKYNNKQEQNHLAIATNGEMTFILFYLLSKDNILLINNEIQLIFPYENIFQFNRSSMNVWRIDQGYVRNPKSLENTIIYQLSKTKFTLFNNETFYIYGTQISFPRRFYVTIDETPATCNYDYILKCIFPILPLNLHDTHKPILKVSYNGYSIYNASLTLIPRTRLSQVPTNYNITDIKTFVVNIDGNLCAKESLKSLFTFIIHLRKTDINDTVQYQNIVKNDMPPIDCNTTAKIGEEIEKIINPIKIEDIISMNVDLTHEWYDHRNCRAERTRIAFINDLTLDY